MNQNGRTHEAAVESVVAARAGQRVLVGCYGNRIDTMRHFIPLAGPDAIWKFPHRTIKYPSGGYIYFWSMDADPAGERIKSQEFDATNTIAAQSPIAITRLRGERSQN